MAEISSWLARFRYLVVDFFDIDTENNKYRNVLAKTLIEMEPDYKGDLHLYFVARLNSRLYKKYISTLVDENDFKGTNTLDDVREIVRSKLKVEE